MSFNRYKKVTFKSYIETFPTAFTIPISKYKPRGFKLSKGY
jgi:hypothetical protein